jgi:hypothetical protein
MTIRTNDDALTRRLFTGIVEAGVSLDDQVDEIHGMMDIRAGSLRRLQGKIMSGTSTTTTVWSIHQLRFRDSNALIEKVNSHLLAQPDLPPLPGMEFVLPTTKPLVLPPDWPNNNAPVQDMAEVTFNGNDIHPFPWVNGERAPTGYNASGAAFDYQITATPNLSFIVPPDVHDVTEKTVTVTSNYLLQGDTTFRIRATFTASWLTVVTGMTVIAPQGIQLASGDLFWGGLWLALGMPLDIRVNTANVTAEDSTATILFTVTDAWGNPIHNSSGNHVTASVTVTLHLEELNMTPVPATLSVSAVEGT